MKLIDKKKLTNKIFHFSNFIKLIIIIVFSYVCTYVAFKLIYAVIIQLRGKKLKQPQNIPINKEPEKLQNVK